MIGDSVRWAKLDAQGKPTLDVEGIVVAVGTDGGRFRLLIRQANGDLKAVDALDMIVVGEKRTDDGDIPWPEPALPIHIITDKGTEDTATNLLQQLANINGHIEALGLREMVNDLSTSEAAIKLLTDLVSELKEMGEKHEADEAQINLLIKEREEALARARAAEAAPKAKAGKVKDGKSEPPVATRKCACPPDPEHPYHQPGCPEAK